MEVNYRLAVGVNVRCLGLIRFKQNGHFSAQF
jgi:hypothetical protein